MERTHETMSRSERGPDKDALCDGVCKPDAAGSTAAASDLNNPRSARLTEPNPCVRPQPHRSKKGGVCWRKGGPGHNPHLTGLHRRYGHLGNDRRDGARTGA